MFDVIIVGAGPVGLHLGVLLLQEGLSVRILEQRTEPRNHSRAIGIHPPALAAMALAGVEAAMLAEGVQIRSGLARSCGAEVARLPFAGSRPFVLTLKQARTEAILAARVGELHPGAVVRGFCVDSVRDGGTFVTLSGSHLGGPSGAGEPGAGPDGAEEPRTGAPGAGEPAAGEHRGRRREHFQARLVVGADGAHSAVRRLLGIPTSGRDYPDTYLMGDFPDDGSDGPEAVLYLEPGGIVESFPLPGGLRRWVVHTDALLRDADAGALAALIRERTGVAVNDGANSMLSAFGVRTRMARRMVRGRVALVGDAAHEISPIGGQGMNLGWLDAAALAPIIVAALNGSTTGPQLVDFERTRMRAARTAARQAHLNMALGRKAPPSFLQIRNATFRHILGLVHPLRELVARRFTMQ